jgi:small redox-active disulfide protein 2
VYGDARAHHDGEPIAPVHEESLPFIRRKDMSAMHIKVLGPGCMNCKNLLETTKRAVKELDADAAIEYVTDMKEIVKYVMSTPGLVIDEHVVHKGKPLPDLDKVKALIRSRMG